MKILRDCVKNSPAFIDSIMETSKIFECFKKPKDTSGRNLGVYGPLNYIEHLEYEVARLTKENEQRAWRGFN